MQYKMKQLTKIHTIRFTEQQAKSLQKLADYNVNVSHFIRLAIKEKIQRDWPSIKESRIKLPFYL
jgi:hypothetical protein